ncbi:hypothetical protein BB934_12630 [Microvirga ossetica]|uniref:Uncharacterized protein n=1 Tax=Microvirga ossetica TaxID=1882682 RepID=A0A1B2EG44_9HYPH|nr:hypothetical protein BB934_12630 [Microvirga ossetica]
MAHHTRKASERQRNRFSQAEQWDGPVWSRIDHLQDEALFPSLLVGEGQGGGLAPELDRFALTPRSNSPAPQVGCFLRQA